MGLDNDTAAYSSNACPDKRKKDTILIVLMQLRSIRISQLYVGEREIVTVYTYYYLSLWQSLVGELTISLTILDMNFFANKTFFFQLIELFAVEFLICICILVFNL